MVIMKRYSMEEIYPKSQMGKCMIYFNMSHHYRRIYSAKARVDTNLPKKPKPEFCCSSPDIFNFVRRNCIKTPTPTTPRHRICLKQEEEQQPLFKPRILPSKVESKVKSMSVYQPPQRVSPKKSPQTNKPEEKPAFNNGKVKIEGIENKNQLIELKESHSSAVLSDQEKNNSNEQVNNENIEDESKCRSVSKSTVMFLKDITDDILRKGIYTNKSLEKLFLHHMRKNKYSLSKEVMEKEIEKLKIELEMPLEEEKPSMESTIEDEEVLTALDSLLLPLEIRERVASSLGLRPRPPVVPLPSPRDSFTGSLPLTSLSQQHSPPHLATQTNNSQQQQDTSATKQNEEKKKETEQEEEDDKKTVSTDNDETTVDEEYPEDPTNTEQTVESQQNIKQEPTIIERQSLSIIETQSHLTEEQSDIKSVTENEKSLSDASEVLSESEESEDEKSETIEPESDNRSNNHHSNSVIEEKKVEREETSDSESIHTDSDMY